MTRSDCLYEEILSEALQINRLDQSHKSWESIRHELHIAGGNLALKYDPEVDHVRDAFNDNLIAEFKRESGRQHGDAIGLVFDGLVSKIAERYPDRTQEVITPKGCNSILNSVKGVKAHIMASGRSHHIGFGSSYSIFSVENANGTMIGNNANNIIVSVLSGSAECFGYYAKDSTFKSLGSVKNIGERSTKSYFEIQNDCGYVLNDARNSSAYVGGDISLRSLKNAKSCFVECGGTVLGSLFYGTSELNELVANRITGKVWQLSGNSYEMNEVPA